MKHVFFFSILMVFAFGLAAQNDSLPAPKPPSLEQKINVTRLALRSSFLQADPAGVGLWVDSLNRLENDTYVGANWDERWLLYYWTENYGALLTEARHFGASERNTLAWKVPPPADSLFEIIDSKVIQDKLLK